MPSELKSFSKSKILVIGDVMLDRYMWGNVGRISPEAPVPIVRVKEKSDVLGGAGNVAANLSGLESRVAVIGLCGSDVAGNRLKELFDEKKIEKYLITDVLRPTITKTRVMAQGQQLFRLDEEEAHLLSSEVQKELFTLIKTKIPEFHAVILSDYGKGIFQTRELCQDIISLCRENKVFVLVDPKGIDWERYNNATCITPNATEFELACNLKIDNEESLTENARYVCENYNLDCLLITRGSNGMCLTSPKKDSFLISAKAREVYDVSGAGDTVIATFASALASGFDFEESANLANIAAGIVVGKLGTQPVTLDELRTAIQINTGNDSNGISLKVATIETAKIQIKSWQTSGEKVIFTNGCYDLLHPGHINLLHQSRALGDRLIVGLNTDDSVKRLKGENRPILSEQDRASILSALGCVDLVVLFSDDTPIHLIENLQPDILVKGADYRLDEVVGREIVESYGGKVCLVPLVKGYSTTGIVNRLSLIK